MAQPDDRDRNYEETVDPKNPPNSVLQPAARSAGLAGSLGVVVVFSLIVAAALIYWMATNRRIDPDPGARDTEQRDQIGTVGERSPGIDQPGGFDPAPKPDSTRDEIEYRGGDASSPRPFTDVNSVLKDKPESALGRRVELRGAEVVAAQPRSFWVHDGNAKVEVISPANGPALRSGQSADVSGTVESDGQGGVRIRADRVAAK